ncbi:hypothetical protein EYC58_00980 [Candidatus Saccharibacteria bacterium]|nr:MAG: hypothetical protein EYC58_00980 [Candidatus Saccharibacteria bacterium]
MASKDITTAELIASLEKLTSGIKKHAAIIFVVIVLAALVYSISNVNVVLGSESDTAYRDAREAEMTSTQFDKATIQKIEALGDRANPPAPVLPGGRINPFIE